MIFAVVSSPATFQTPNAMKTFEQSEPEPLNESTFSAADSPAKISAPPENVPESKATEAAFGESIKGSFANYDPASRSWKTSQLCLTGELSGFSETWPRSGMMRNGSAFERQTLVPLIDETEFGLWPTPAGFGTDGHGSELSQATKYRENPGGPIRVKWPTPKAGRPDQANTFARGNPNLAKAVTMWPTPTVQDAENDGGPSQFNRNSLPLNSIVKLFATPQANDHWSPCNSGSERASGMLPTQINGQLNPT